MRKGKGKNKGNAFERLVSNALDAWWKVPKGTFWRSKISGGSNEPGDITPRVLEVDDKPLQWPFVIECKHYKEIKFSQLLNASKLKEGGQIVKWWKQLTDDYESTGYTKIRLLIFRGNNTPIYVAFRPLDIERVGARLITANIKDKISYSNSKFLKDDIICICKWDNFSSVMTKDIFIKEEE